VNKFLKCYIKKDSDSKKKERDAIKEEMYITSLLAPNP